MSSARDAIERIQREREERSRNGEEAKAATIKLHAGIPDYWQQVQSYLTQELDTFKEGIRPHADTLQGQAANNNNFTIYWSGLRMIEVVLNEPSRTLEVIVTDVKQGMDSRSNTYRFSYDGHAVTLGGYSPAQLADVILKPLFDSYR